MDEERELQPVQVRVMEVPRLALNQAEAAEALGVSAKTLSEWHRQGWIPAKRVGRRLLYPVESLRAWLCHAGKIDGDGGDERTNNGKHHESERRRMADSVLSP